MTKSICILLAFLLLANLAFANPVEAKSESNNTQWIILGILTLGIGLVIYNIFFQPRTALFTEEKIDITLQTDGSVEVIGNYTFTRNKESLKHFQVIYPFPKFKEFGEVEDLEISVNGRKMDYLPKELKFKEQVTLEMFFNGYGECNLKIRFVQKPTANHYKYILKTTRSWKKPLLSSIINLHVAEGFVLNECNYELNKMDAEKAGFSSFQLHEKDFYPDEDFEFSWNEK
ncbi:MAG: hypothetical protein Q7J16_13735 [Candidatus Cloacimonadales bacterium]|nr:hypothetical protein [Candidatus Cloacimonadales bacterium]